MAWGLFTAASGTKQDLRTYCWTNEPKKGISKHKVIKRCWAPNISTSTRYKSLGKAKNQTACRERLRELPRAMLKAESTRHSN